MMTNYIYLLQEREFIKTKENVYKIGMTKKENCKRFNQYPKGSILLFQIICNNCKNIETQIIELFKEKYIQRRDIGSEYFEGSYKNMIEFMYQYVKNEDIAEEIIEKQKSEFDSFLLYFNEKYIITESKHDFILSSDLKINYNIWCNDNAMINNIKSEANYGKALKLCGVVWKSEVKNKNRCYRFLKKN
jgi:hypothetical protein